MSISVILKDQAGEVLLRMSRAYAPLVKWAERSEYPILGHVDPYGHTIYNRPQMKTLIAELERIGRSTDTLDEDAIAIIDGLRDLCEEGLKKPHRYLWFIGD